MTVPFNFSIKEIHDMFKAGNYQGFIEEKSKVLIDESTVEIITGNDRIYFSSTCNFLDFVHGHRCFRIDDSSLNIGYEFNSKLQKHYHLNKNIEIHKAKSTNTVSETHKGNGNVLFIEHRKGMKVFSLSSILHEPYTINEYEGCVNFTHSLTKISMKNKNVLFMCYNYRGNDNRQITIDYDFKCQDILELFEPEFLFNLNVLLDSEQLQKVHKCLLVVLEFFDKTKNLNTHMKRLSLLTKNIKL